MFEFIRNHQRLMQFLLLVLIVPPFAFFGIDGYKRFTDEDTAVAKVAGQLITQQEYAQAQREQLERQRELAQRLNVPFDPAMFDLPAAREATLETLVTQRVLATQAVKSGIVVTDEKLREVIAAIPAVQDNGKFSKERYTNLLAAQGMTPPVFENKLRGDLAMQALNAGVGESAFAPRSVQAMVARGQEESREVQEFAVKADAFAAQVKVTAEAVRAHYDANQKDFVIAPQMRAEYVVLSADAIGASLTPPPEQIKAFYDQNSARYREEEQRQASHILLKFEGSSDRAALRARAEDLVKQARAPGADFAALARKHSQDPGSAAKGGELGSFGRGAMVKPFEDAVFGMQAGQVSGVVESEFGYHIIKLAGIKPGKVRTLEEVRAEIELEWRRREGQKKFSESAEGFTNTVYEQPDSLKPAADKYRLRLFATEAFNREAPPRELANARLLDRLFSDESVKAKRNTEAIEIAPGILVSARVVDYMPQSVKPFAEASAGITKLLERREALTLARKEGEAKFKAAQQSADAISFGAATSVSRLKVGGLSAEALRAIMAAPGDKLPTVIGVAVEDGYRVYRINKVEMPAKPDPNREAAIRSALGRAQAEGDFSAYLEAVKALAKVTLFKERIEKKAN
ncbi:MAG: SurA N-terminal domain-containing protein [Burkholderiales bacterium]